MQRILQPGEIESIEHLSFPRVRLPVPGSIFRDRANRLRQLANGGPLDAFLHYVAALMDAQHAVAKSMPVPAAPDAARLERAQRHAMPIWQLPADLGSDWSQALQQLLVIVRDAPEPEAPMREHIDELAAMDERALRQLIDAMLAGVPLNEGRRVKTPFMTAALQVAMTARAAALGPDQIPYVDPPTVCPVCSSQPVASVIRIDGTSAGLRYLHCSICATEWHMVRVKCSNCASTGGISYRRLDLNDVGVGKDDGGAATMAELCDSCGSYRKIFDLQKDHQIEPMSDDLATVMLDILMGENDYPRAGHNPFLYLNMAEDQPESDEASGQGGAADGKRVELPDNPDVSFN